MEALQLGRYKRIDAPKIATITKTEPLWYKYGPVSEIIDRVMVDSYGQDIRGEREEFVSLLGRMLRLGQVSLGNRQEGFNDDDRWGGKFARTELKDLTPDTVVVHHTHANQPFDYMNALGLLRLYVPIYRSSKKTIEEGGFGIDQPISSGHFLGERQVFVGYHDLIWPNGTRTKALKSDYTGFHSRNYKLGCQSYGVALVGDFSLENPSELALNTARQVISEKNPKRVMGHSEVIDGITGELVKTDCPGITYFGPEGWRNRITDLP